MIKLNISEDQLNQIVRLRQKGSTWTDIQKELKIDRRKAKTEFKKWESDSSNEELRKVRSGIAAEEFRSHMESIVMLAERLVVNLDVLPPSMYDMKETGSEYMELFLDQDILERYTTSIPPKKEYIMYPIQRFSSVNPRIYLEEKRLLYKALKTHTRQVQWNILDEWSKCRDTCVATIPQFIKQANDCVNNTLRNANDTGFLRIIKKVTNSDEPDLKITRVMVNGIWRYIKQNNKQAPIFETVTNDDKLLDLILKFGDGGYESIFRLNGEERQQLADKLTKQCNSVINVLIGLKTFSMLRSEVSNIKTASDKLRTMLHPLKLRPMILRSRCDLCPVPL